MKNILLFILGAAFVLGLVVWLEKDGFFDQLLGKGDVKATPVKPPAEPPDTIIEVSPDAKPSPKPQPKPQPKPEPKPEPKVEPPAAPALIGDGAYMIYHRPECKLVAFIAAEKKSAFATATAAFDRGFIPCKVCKPELPGPKEEVKPVPPPEEKKAPEAEPARPVSTKLVGDSARHRYHRSDCALTRAIAAASRVPLRSAADAFAAEYFPCRSCNPDLPALAAELPNIERPALDGKLTDRDKRAMYKSLFALKAMLKGIGTRERPYEVLSDRYRVPIAAVEAVEAEGNAGNWPTQ